MIKLLIIIGLMLGVSNVAVVAQDDDMDGIVINFCTGDEWVQIISAINTTIQTSLADVTTDIGIGETIPLRLLHFLTYEMGQFQAQCSSTSARSESYESEGMPLIVQPGQYLIEVIADQAVTLTIEQRSDVGADCNTVVVETEPFDANTPQAWELIAFTETCGTQLFVETEAEVWEVYFKRLAEPGFQIEE